MDAWPRRAWYGAVAAACIGAALVCTWPLALRLASALPLGTESAATIPLFDLWTLWWSADRVGHGYAGLWNAPIFHPTQGTFTFSEPLLLPGALAAPLFALHAPPALIHNLVLLAILAGNGALACRLARALGAPRLPALLAGVLMVALPFLAKMQGELPLLALAGTLAALGGLVRFGDDGRTRHAVAAAAGIVAEALCCQQLALFSLPFVAAAALVALAQRHFERGALVHVGAAALAAGLALFLCARTPLRVHREEGFARAEELVESLSARPADFFTRPSGAVVPFPPEEDPSVYTGGLFPGVLVLGLAFLGARWPPPDRCRWRWYAVGSCAFAVLLTLGLNFSLAGWRPFAALRALPGFSEMRSPFRCAVFLQAHLVLLAALGLAALLRRRSPALVVTLGLLAALETTSLPARLLPLPRRPRTAWTAYLAGQPAGTVVAHVPFPRAGNVEDFVPEAWRLFAQLDHRQPLVNGYASNLPAIYREFMYAMAAKFPDHALACALHTFFGAGLLVVDQDWLAEHRPGFAALGPMLAQTYADAAVAIFRFQPAPSECPPVRLEVAR
ncbi:MAG TPA: hypothetical protein VFH73_24385 [Polyangia bacterium]|jgi:hypothetical protein|nr:hypothetical protein [Polyangia bacterium]